MDAILKFDFQKRGQSDFSEENYLNYTNIDTILHIMTNTCSINREKQEHPVDSFWIPLTEFLISI